VAVGAGQNAGRDYADDAGGQAEEKALTDPNRHMPSDIILIGPLRAGKSTLSRLLAQKLKVPQVSLDDARWVYYKEIGYDEAFAREIRQKGGFLALAFYWKLFDAYTVERVLIEHRQCVIDFGAGASVYENVELFARVQQALAAYPNVVLLLPSPDPAESIRVLNERTQDLVGTFSQGFNWNEYFVRHPSNYALAKHVVYTQDKTPDETCDEILSRVRAENTEH
jgi:adenylate kinase family enzyme